MAQQLPGLMAQMPEELKRFLPHAELDLAATIAANAPGAGVASAPSDPYCPAHPHEAGAKEGVHEGVTCDKSGVCPIVGNRYHLVGHNYDLCEAEFEKLTDKEKALYQRIPPPFVHPMPNETNNSNNDHAVTGIHPGVECDRSGMAPIVGMRYHLRGHNYDLCQAEYDKLSQQEKLLYTAIPPPVTPAGCGGNNNKSNNGCANKRGLRGAEFFKGSGRFGPHMAANGWGWGGGGCHGWGGGGGGWGAGGGWGGGGHCGGMMANPAKLAARFVRDVTIF